MRYSLITILALVLAHPLAAQEWQVAREQVPFAGTRLDIRVDARSEGSLQVIRGGPGLVRIASRATAGLTAAGLADDDELTLTAAGAGPVQFLVSVPEDVGVRVHLPGRMRGETLSSRATSATFAWGEAGESGAAAEEWLPPLTEDTPLYTTYTQGPAPRVVTLPDLSTIRSLSVRVEGNRFRVNTGRPLTVASGGADRIEIRTIDPPMDIVLVIPAGTPEFRLEAAGTTALVVEDGSVAVFCSPVTRQRLSHGRQWVTFNPVEGSLRCDPPPHSRHEG